MRPSRVFRWAIRALLLVSTLSLSAVSLLGGWSAVTILNPSSNDINIPDGDITYNSDFVNTSSIEILVPFNISNGGVYELSNIFLRFQVSMTFENISNSNETTSFQIFDTHHLYGSVLPGQTLKANFSGTGTLPISDVNWDRSPYVLDFYTNLTFSASYSLNLYTLTVNIINASLGHYL